MSRFLFRAALLVLSMALASVVPAFAAGADGILDVEVDHARVLKIARPAETVIIGNPAIVDVTIHDASTLVLTGRSFGLTNLVVLDGAGEAILDERIAVTSDETNSVRVFRQADRTTYACNPQCQPSLTVGDEDSAFARTAGQFAAREQMAAGATP